MQFRQQKAQLSKLPLFSSSQLYAGAATPQQIQRQLADWVRDGKLVQLRRGLYTLAPPHQRIRPHSYLVANQLVRGSYVSLQTALAYYDLIPEHVPVIASVTTGRPGRWQNSYGRFHYQHLQPALFFGFVYREVVAGQFAYLATPEKALLDLVYLTPDADNEAYLRSLRLQNLDLLDLDRLAGYIERAGKPKLQRALAHVRQLVAEEIADYSPL